MNWPRTQNVQPGMIYPTLNVPTPTFQNSRFQNFTQNADGRITFELTQKCKDEEFINEFVRSKSVKKIVGGIPPTLKIYKAKQFLAEIVSLKLQLEALSNDLDLEGNDFDVKWEEITNRKKRIHELLSEFDADSLQSLKKALEKRKKKRNWERRRKIKEREAKKEFAEDVRLKHALIDKLLREKSKEAESVKRTEALRRQADSVLHEVRRKKYEARRVTNMLSALAKLREVRVQQEVARGGYCSKEITETFNNVMTQFQDLWKKQIDLYNFEEKGLKVMLEEGEIPQVKISNFQKILNQWEHAFFGTLSLDDNCRLLTLADEDINLFTLIRRDWDQYITDDSSILSSCIPVGWVSPPETNDEDWKAFLRLKKKLK